MGSIPFAYLAVKWLRGIDLRTVGSGNVGATNAGRVLGRPAAVAIYLLDAVKGAGAVLTARGLSAAASPALEVACGLLAILGHVFPVWLRFKGGKGVATTTGVFAALTPAAFAIAGGVWLLTAALTRYVSLASIALGLALPAAIVLLEGRAAFAEGAPVFGLAVAAAVFIAARHAPNLRRVAAGTEPKIGRVKPATPAPEVPR
jgi:glycerol-3-phosphate acyltransferase PlsY